MTPTDILKLARSLLTPPSAWTKDWEARDFSRRTTSALDPEAVCWCAAGAIWRAGAKAEDPSWEAEKLLREVVGDSIPEWNDAAERTHPQVLAAFDTAISLSELKTG